jgi:hypothetical protein
MKTAFRTSGRRNERTTRGDAPTSCHDEMTRGWCNKRRHNLIVFRVQTESTGKVAAMDERAKNRTIGRWR